MSTGRVEALTPEEIAEVREAFDMYDLDHDGKITIDEWYLTCQKIGKPVCREKVEKRVKFADLDKNGTVSFDELKYYFTSDDIE